MRHRYLRELSRILKSHEHTSLHWQGVVLERARK